MPTDHSRPIGTSGKDPLVPGANVTQSPWAVPLQPGPSPISPPGGVEAMDTLIKTIILNNSCVRKLNAFHKICRSNPREVAAVLEDEEESPYPHWQHS